jgi:COP9 signalosome complex subunit 1
MQMCLNVIRVSIEMSNYTHVFNYVSKAEQTPDLTDKVLIAKLKVAAGLANLDSRKYKLAARKFVETTFDLGNRYNEVVSAADVAIYGGLCALATFDRSELKKRVIDNVEYQNFLELTPELRQLINDFYSSRYASCLKHLDNIKSSLLLDMHLHAHVESLYERVRNKALVQYFSPFKSVDMVQMAEAFNTTVQRLEKELSPLIMDGQIQARIDSHNKRLYARQTDQRNATFDKALQLGDEYEANAKQLLLRASLLRAEFVVKGSASEAAKKKQDERERR